jgi:hypothetical protein
MSPGSVVDEHHVLLDGLAAGVQLIGGEVRIGVADRQAAQDRKFGRDRQLRGKGSDLVASQCGKGSDLGKGVRPSRKSIREAGPIQTLLKLLQLSA